MKLVGVKYLGCEKRNVRLFKEKITLHWNFGKKCHFRREFYSYNIRINK